MRIVYLRCGRIEKEIEIKKKKNIGVVIRSVRISVREDDVSLIKSVAGMAYI